MRSAQAKLLLEVEAVSVCRARLLTYISPASVNATNLRGSLTRHSIPIKHPRRSKGFGYCEEAVRCVLFAWSTFQSAVGMCDFLVSALRVRALNGVLCSGAGKLPIARLNIVRSSVRHCGIWIWLVRHSVFVLTLRSDGVSQSGSGPSAGGCSCCLRVFGGRGGGHLEHRSAAGPRGHAVLSSEWRPQSSTRR